jgi:NADH-quinone oxidoreductase subunit L
MRNMGGMRNTMPITFWLYLIGTIALAGLPPFAGFWSKDEILLDASHHFPLIYQILSVTAFLTAFYMGRQIWMVFFGEARTDAAKHAQESPKIMTIPLMVLAFLSMAGGALNLPFEGYHTLGHWLEHTIEHVEAMPLDLTVAGVSTLLAIFAIAISWYLYGHTPLKLNQPDPLKKLLGPIFRGMEGKWFIDEIYDTLIVGTYHWLGETLLSQYAERKGIDAFFNSWGTSAKWSSSHVCKTQTGLVRSYAMAMLFGLVAILGYLVYLVF